MHTPASHAQIRSASNLKGHTLPGGWRLGEQLGLGVGGAGHLTHTYHAIRGNLLSREHAFVKVHDFATAWALPSPQREEELERMLGCVNHERELLELCKGNGMDRVINVIDTGSYVPPGGTNADMVTYLVMELADGDVRDAISGPWEGDPVARFGALRDLARGLSQMNGQSYAHQDLKPDNALTFSKQGVVKLGDVESASHPRPRRELIQDEADFAGDRAYAPIEMLYGFRHPEWTVRHLGCDIYLLGSMAFSLFCGLGATQMILRHLPTSLHPGSGHGYASALPHVQAAFAEALEELGIEIEPVAGRDASRRLVHLVAGLCDPSPDRRGHPSARRFKHGTPFDMARCVEDFGLLERLARGHQSARRSRGGA